MGERKIATMAFDQMKFSGRLATRVPASFGSYEKIQKLSEEGRLKEALHLLKLMAHQPSGAPKGAFVCLVRGCTRRKALAEGKLVHALLVQSKYYANVFLSNLLIDMYCNCGSVVAALNVFAAMPQRNVFSWTAMISAYVNSGQYKEAITLFKQMQETGIEPDKVLQTTLIDVYAKCGCLKEARKLFNNMRQQDLVSWNVMIAGYAQEGLGKEALDLYELMKHEGVEPNHITLVLLLKACASISALEQGRELHSLILEKCLESETTLQTTLVDMYAKCGCLMDARKVFDSMSQRNVVSWSAMIAGYAQKGLGMEALDLYEQMKCEGVEPNHITLVLLLKACASVSALEKGRKLHSLILEKGLESELSIQNTLVDMYAKCGCLKDARELFNDMRQRDVVSWNTMIASYAQEGLGKEALDLYEQMKRQGVKPNTITVVLLLKACSSILALEEGKELHYLITEKGFESDMTVQNSLIDMYAKCGCLIDARELFNNMARRNVVSWNAMIAGYAAQKRLAKEALELYEQMKCEFVEPDHITLVLLLKACASISALEQIKELHSLIVEKGLDSETTVQNTLVDVYAKCGCLNYARKLFNNMLQRDVVSWNAIIGGYAQEGLGKEALDLYEQMKHEGMQGNKVTYTCVLSACSHSGLLDKGHRIFESMFTDDGVTPTYEHYACMADLLGRAGFLASAEDIILKMPIQPPEGVWMSLLGAARKHVNVEIGRRAFERVVELQPEEKAAPYLLLVDIYLAAGRMDEVAELRREMKRKGLEKVPG